MLSLQKGLEFPEGGGGGVVGSVRPRHLKKCMKLNGVSRGMGRYGSSIGEVWIFLKLHNDFDSCCFTAQDKRLNIKMI